MSAPTTREEAIALALDWAKGRRSWTNLGPPHEGSPYTPDVIAVMDAQEVVKWTAVAAVLPADPDYSPGYQDEYQRLWHKAAQERDNLRRLCRPVVERFGALLVKDDAYYAAAEILGIEESPGDS